jgi:hypothetical protein
MRIGIIINLVANLVFAGLCIKEGQNNSYTNKPWFYLLIVNYILQTIGSFLGNIN